MCPDGLSRSPAGTPATIRVHGGTSCTRSGHVQGRVRGLRGRSRAVVDRGPPAHPGGPRAGRRERRRLACRGRRAVGRAGRTCCLHPTIPMTGESGNGVLQYAFSLLNLVLGVLLIVRRPNDLVPRLLALGLLGTAATFNLPSHEAFHILGSPWPIALLHFTFHIVSGVAYLWAVALFPDGRLPVAGGRVQPGVDRRGRRGDGGGVVDLLVERFPGAPTVLRDLLRDPDPGRRRGRADAPADGRGPPPRRSGAARGC